MNQREQIAITSRIFCLAAIFGLTLVSHDPGTIEVVVAVCAVGAMSAYVASSLGRTTLVLLTAETLIVSLLMGLTYHKSAVLLPYLVVLPLLARWIG